MVIGQEDLLKAIDVELEYREQQRSEGLSGVDEEIAALQSLRERVRLQVELKYADYEWLCYMVHNNLQKEEE